MMITMTAEAAIAIRASTSKKSLDCEEEGDDVGAPVGVADISEGDGEGTAD